MIVTTKANPLRRGNNLEVCPFLSPFARTLARTLRIEIHGKYGTLVDRRRVVVNGAVIISY